MTRKLTFLTLVAAAFLSLGTAFAQDSGKVNFYEVVPKHEFFIEDFAGIGSLIYSVPGYPFAANLATTAPQVNAPKQFNSLWIWNAGDLLSTKWPVGLSSGLGFGYIWHITPVVGLMTGAQFAIYNGGIDMSKGGGNNQPNQLITAETVKTSGEQDMFLFYTGNYVETQKLMAVQVPLMLHLMAPMGRGNHFFYAAIGGKLGINVYGSYAGSGIPSRDWDPYYPDGEWSQASPNTYAPLFNEINGNEHTFHYGEVPNYNYTREDIYDENGEVAYASEGKLLLKPINVLGSVELGFRWKFGKGWGLYTGIYADYGFLGVNKTAKHAMFGFPEDFDEPDLTKHSPNDNYPKHSVINAQGAPDIAVRAEADPTGGRNAFQHRYEDYKNVAGAVRPFAAGLKLKLAFGKVKPAAPAPVVLPPKPDTVVKTVIQTVVVRDTVVKNNTVVVRDTVEKVNTVVVRDTVVVIKEVPQEIKDVMVELSNTLFAFNKFNLTDKAREGLNKVAAWLNENPDVKVEISGHTDGVGSDSYNQKLSQQRAKSVYEYFIHEGGVSSKRLSYKGYGKSQPIATNDTEEGRQMNRRVELNIIQ